MATELEKALSNARYTALPLPRSKASPNTIYAFQRGQLYIVRNPGTCLKLPVTEDPTADVLQFDREYGFNLSGIVGLLTRVFGIGNAKAELSVQNVHSASVRLSGLAHMTIETGALIDYLMGLQPDTCLRDITDKDHLTIVAALRANTFTFTFKSKSGSTISLALPEVKGLFSIDASTSVDVLKSGEIMVNSPSYVGVVSWDGGQIAKEIKRARQYAEKPRLRPFVATPPREGALATTEVWSHQLRSLGLKPFAQKKSPPAASGTHASPKKVLKAGSHSRRRGS